MTTRERNERLYLLLAIALPLLAMIAYFAWAFVGRELFAACPPDCRGHNFQGGNLSALTLRNADLREANLSGVFLDGVDLRSADLSFANLSNASAVGADFSDAAICPGGQCLHRRCRGAMAARRPAGNTQ